MPAAPKQRELARRLARLSVEDGAVSPAKVQEVLAYLRAKAPTGLRAILKSYLYFIQREIKTGTALVEYAGQPSAAALAGLQASLTAEYQRPVRVMARENPALLAGLRIRVGDDVIDHSVAGRLAALQSALD